MALTPPMRRGEVELMRSRCSGAIKSTGAVVDAMMSEEFSTFSIGFMLFCFYKVSVELKERRGRIEGG
jgi:hypothetical protein